MKRFASHIPRCIALTLALCSIGAKTSKCTPAGSQSNQGTQSSQDLAKPFCYTDPPVRCIAFCVGVDEYAFTPMCDELGAGELTDLFKEEVIIGVLDLRLREYRYALRQIRRAG